MVVVGTLGWLLDAGNGATVGMLALIAAFAAEALLLGHRLRRLDAREPRLFET